MRVPTMPTPEALLEHAGFIRSLARTLVADDATADDVVQQTYLAALENPPRHASNLRSWLGKVARNFAFRARRTETRVKRREEHAPPREPAPSPEEVAARLEVQRQVVEAVMALDEPYRSTVVLRYFDDCPPEEIARRMGVPKETVRTRLRRAAARMRDRLDDAHGGDRKAWVVVLLPLAGLGTREASAAAAVSTKAAAGRAAITGGLLMSSKAFWTVAAAVLVAAVLFVWKSGQADPVDPHVVRAKSAEAQAGGAPATPAGEAATGNDETERVQAFVLKAVVVDPDGQPLPGALARMKNTNAIADADGRLVLRGIGQAVQIVEVTHPGFVKARKRIDPLRDEEHEIKLVPGAPLSAVVLDKQGQPIAGVGVRAHTVQIEGVAGMFRSIQTNPLSDGVTGKSGGVDLGTAPSGTVELRIDEKGYAPVNLRIGITGTDRVMREIRLERGGTLTGTVSDGHGRPVPDATVFIEDYQHRGAKTDAQGRFTLSHVGAGPQAVFAKRKGFGVGYFGTEKGWGEPVEVTVRDGDTLRGIDIVMPPGVMAKGRVIDQATGKPLAGVMASVHVPAPPYALVNVKTDENGRFEAGPFTLVPNRYAQASFVIAGYRINMLRKKPDGAWIDFGDIEAKPGGTIAGRVLDPQRRPISRVRVWLLPSKNPVAVDAEGHFRTGTIPPGKGYRLQAEAPGFRSPQVVAATGDEDVELVLRETLSIRGRVITPDGKPRVGVHVVAFPDGATRAVASDYSGDDGRFEIKELPTGRYRVAVRRAGKVLTDAQTETGKDVDLVLPIEGGILKGRVVTATGEPIRSFSAKFIRYRFLVPNGFRGQDYTSDDGSFVHEVDRAGTWGVEIQATGYAPTRPQMFNVKPGTTVDVGTIKLGPGGAIAGTVVDAQGQPVPYARIHFLSATLETNQDPPFTDREGRYEIRTVAAGVYNVFAVSPSHPLAVARSVKVEGGKATRLDFRFSPKAPLTVVVLDDDDSRPIEGAELTYSFASVAPLRSNSFRAYEPPGWGLHETDKNGVVVKPALPAGKVTIYIERVGYSSASRTVSLEAGKPMRIEVRLRR